MRSVEDLERLYLRQANIYQEKLQPLEGLFDHQTMVAALAAAMGGLIIQQGLGIAEKDIELKPDNTYVAEGDRASQEAMNWIMRRALSGSVISAEEKQTGFERNPEERLISFEDEWFEDGRDGTAIALRGIPGSAAAIGSFKRAAVRISGEDRLVIGQTGVGVVTVDMRQDVIQPKFMKTTSWSEVRKPMMAADMVIRGGSGPRMGDFIAHLREVTGKDWSTTVACNITNALRVAMGQAEFALLTAKGGFWDLVGHLMTMMAGGKACDQYGNPLSLDTECGLATCDEELQQLMLPLLRNCFDGYNGFAAPDNYAGYGVPVSRQKI